MLYLLRCFVWAVVVGGLFAGCFFLLRKVGLRKRIICSIALVLSAAVVWAFWQPDYALITFSSPEKAYSYAHPFQAEMIVEGENSAYVVGRNGGADTVMIVSKTEKGWKLTKMLDRKQVGVAGTEDYFVYVFRYADTSDYYVMVNLTYQTGALPEPTVTDNRDTEFCFRKILSNTGTHVDNRWYAYVEDLDEDYQIIIDGEVLPVGKDMIYY